MNNINQKTITVLAIVGLSIAVLGAANGLNTVFGDELNTNDFQYTVHITDVIDHFTYAGMSNFLSDNQQSFEDIDTFRFVIEDSNYYAVYNNGANGNFNFVGIYENGA